MSLKRSFLKEILADENLSDGEKINKIIDGHMETVVPLQDEIDGKKLEIKALKDKEKELELIKKDDYKGKFEKIKKEFDEFKSNTEKQKIDTTRRTAFENSLKEAGIADKYIKSILKITDINDIEFDENNEIKDKDKFKSSVIEQYSDFIQKEGKQGLPENKPPENNGGTAFDLLPLNEKMAYANQHPDSPDVANWLKK